MVYEQPQHAGKYFVRMLSHDLTLVYGKSENSLPITTVKVESQPCADPNQVSASSGTLSLPNEIMAVGLCVKQEFTGYTNDGRFKAA